MINSEEEIPVNFMEADILINEAFQDVFGFDRIPITFLVGIAQNNLPVGIGAGFDPYSLLGADESISELSKFDNWGIVATGTMWPQTAGESLTEEEAVKLRDDGTSHNTFMFLAIWDGSLVSSIRIVRPEGVTAEMTEDGEFPYGQPIYSAGKSMGQLSDAMKFAHIMSRKS